MGPAPESPGAAELGPRGHLLNGLESADPDVDRLAADLDGQLLDGAQRSQRVVQGLVAGPPGPPAGAHVSVQWSLTAADDDNRAGHCGLSVLKAGRPR